MLRETSLVVMTPVAKLGKASRLGGGGLASVVTKPVKRDQLYRCLLATQRRQECAAAMESSQFPVCSSVADNHRQKARILVVDDNVINQKVTLGMLRKLGYRADVAENGRDAVRALESTRYDLVLMDCQMPEMDGYEATREIRNPGSRVLDHGVTIIAMTASTMPGDRDICIEAGMDGYVSKPIKLRALADVIGKWLSEVGEPRPDGKVGTGAALRHRKRGEAASRAEPV